MILFDSDDLGRIPPRMTFCRASWGLAERQTDVRRNGRLKETNDSILDAISIPTNPCNGVPVVSKFSLFSVAILLVGSLATFANAAPPVLEQRVAVVDVARVFKNHRRFNQELELLKKDAEDFQTQMRGVQEQLQQRVDAARAQDPNSAAFRAAEAELTAELARLQVTQRQKGRELAEKEARLYFEIYVQVTSAIANHADNNGVNLVLRYNSEPIDPADPKSIIEGVNREVMFQRGHDITDQIIAMVNGGQAAPATATRPTVPTR